MSGSTQRAHPSKVRGSKRPFARPTEASPTNDTTHWKNNGGSMCLIGKGMGAGMVDLLNPWRERGGRSFNHMRKAAATRTTRWILRSGISMVKSRQSEVLGRVPTERSKI